MRTILTTAAVLLNLALTAAADGPSLKVYLALKGETLRRTSDIEHLVLANVGKDAIEVPTANMVATVRETGDAATLSLSVWRPTLWKGHRLVASRYEYLPTVLKPDQAVICKLPIEKIAKTLDVLLDTAKELRVIFKVSKESGEQFDFWSGAVRSEPYAVGKK